MFDNIHDISLELYTQIDDDNPQQPAAIASNHDTATVEARTQTLTEESDEGVPILFVN